MTPAWEAVRLTVVVATVATVLVAIPSTPLAWFLARRRFPGKALLSALVGLPLVLPPTAIGYLLLRILSAETWLGRALNTAGWDLLLTWKAAVLASAVMALPLFVRTARVAFEGIDERLEEVAHTLGHSPVRTFFRFTLPLASRGLAAAVILAFTRGVGEFGATVMLAGNIPGRTQTLASAIYSAQQIGADSEARLLLIIALALGLGAILVSEHLVQQASRRNVASARFGSSASNARRPE